MPDEPTPEDQPELSLEQAVKEMHEAAVALDRALNELVAAAKSRDDTRTSAARDAVVRKGVVAFAVAFAAWKDAKRNESGRAALKALLRVLGQKGTLTVEDLIDDILKPGQEE